MFLQKILFCLVYFKFHLVAGSSLCGCKKFEFYDQHLTGSNTNDGKRKLAFVVDDMVLSKTDLLMYRGAKTYRADLKTWPNKTINFHFEDNFDKKWRNKIRSRLQLLANQTRNCVHFVESSQRPYVSLTMEGLGCSATVGFSASAMLNLDRDYCFKSPRSVVHEMMHVLGIFHTHTRPDRDEYLIINWKNIQSKFCYGFSKCNGCSTHLPYDYESVMHYSSYGFPCKEGLVTMTKKNGDLIPYNILPSKGDIALIRDLYGCH